MSNNKPPQNSPKSEPDISEALNQLNQKLKESGGKSASVDMKTVTPKPQQKPTGSGLLGEKVHLSQENPLPGIQFQSEDLPPRTGGNSQGFITRSDITSVSDNTKKK